MVVDDDMQGAADVEVRRLGQHEGLLVDALSRERCVAVDLKVGQLSNRAKREE